MQQALVDCATAADLIKAGKTLLVAGDDNLLKQLPVGNWIGGTIPYFVGPEAGGISTKEKIFITDISAIAAKTTVKTYSKETLGNVYSDSGGTGFSFIIIPASSSAHTSFAVNAPNYKNFGCQPLLGWIAGVHLEDLGKQQPKTYNGADGSSLTDEATVMHVTLPPGKAADVGIINLFEQGDGDTLTFENDGFSCTDVMINGVRENFADYLTKHNIDTKLPLVADYYGALVNISFQSVTPGEEVNFYAPVFSGIRYKVAKPVLDYATDFAKQLEENHLSGQNVVFSCNCILNYLYSNLEGKKTADFVGPITFGEIAYQLLNQTLVYLQVNDAC